MQIFKLYPKLSEVNENSLYWFRENRKTYFRFRKMNMDTSPKFSKLHNTNQLRKCWYISINTNQYNSYLQSPALVT